MAKRGLGNLELQLFAYVQLRQSKTLKTGDLIEPLSITAKQEKELLSRLKRAGLIAKVRTGFYLIPSRLPLGSKWSPDPVLALNTLMEDKKGKYQICGPNAFNRYGFDEQIPIRIFAYNNRISGERTIGSTTFSLIKVSDKRLGSTEEMKTNEGETAVYSSRIRTLFDAVYDWSRFGTLPRAYTWIKKGIKSGSVMPNKIAEVTLKFGDTGTIRRIGFLMERIGIQQSIIAGLNRRLKTSTAFIPLVPGRAKRGQINRRWGIVNNLREQDGL